MRFSTDDSYLLQVPFRQIKIKRGGKERKKKREKKKSEMELAKE